MDKCKTIIQRHCVGIVIGMGAAVLVGLVIYVALAVIEARPASAQDNRIPVYSLAGIYRPAFEGAGIRMDSLLGSWCEKVHEPTSAGVYRVGCWARPGGVLDRADVDIDTMTVAEVDARVTAALASGREPAFITINPPYFHAGYAGRYAAAIHGLGTDQYSAATRACVQVQGQSPRSVGWNPARTRVVPFSIGTTGAAALTASSVQVGTVGVSLHAGNCDTSAIAQWTYSLPLAS